LLLGQNLSTPPYKIQENLQFNDRVEQELFKVAKKCSEVFPNNRFQSVNELSEVLMKIEKDFGMDIRDNKEFKKASIGQSDSLLKEKHNRITIGIIGVDNGVGVTHLSILLAGFFSKKNKTALVELNKSGHFEAIGEITDNYNKRGEKNFVYDKVSYYWGIDYTYFVRSFRENYQYIILDLGNYKSSQAMEEFLRSDIRIVVAHGMDWKLKEVKSFYQETEKYDCQRNWIYAFPFMDKKTVAKMKEWLKNPKAAIPYNMNPFQLNQETKKTIQLLLE